MMQDDDLRMPGVTQFRLIRGLVIAGLGVAVFLLSAHVSAWLAMRSATVPLCGWSSWFDCDTVLSHPRWSQWLSVPIVLPAALLYGLLTWAALTFTPHKKPQPRRWLILQAGSAAAALVAVWFITIQVAVLGSLCVWCMAEHLISLTLAGLIWSHTLRVEARRLPIPAVLSVGAAAVLIAGQLLVSPSYTTQIMVGEVDDAGRYIEQSPEADAVTLAAGQVVLNRRAHLLIGSPQAEHVFVEVIDYTCPRCRRLAGMLDEALAQLRPNYAALVVTYPLSHECNPTFAQTDARHAASCALAELAHAVWATDASAFKDYHDWLFTEQDAIDADLARAEAERRVGAEALAATLRDEGVTELRARDIRIADHLEVMTLPGLLAAGQRFHALPDDPAALADLIRQAFESPAE
ncbi:MAG: vitamin K epoxide reductase family protein [Phycisphaeraceae bacterium]